MKRRKCFRLDFGSEPSGRIDGGGYVDAGGGERGVGGGGTQRAKSRLSSRGFRAIASRGIKYRARSRNEREAVCAGLCAGEQLRGPR
jgi:hypothetical protein